LLHRPLFARRLPCVSLIHGNQQSAGFRVEAQSFRSPALSRQPYARRLWDPTGAPPVQTKHSAVRGSRIQKSSDLPARSMALTPSPCISRRTGWARVMRCGSRPASVSLSAGCPCHGAS
jgi:hypothetical protein